VGRAPADLHPPLNKTKVAKAVVEVRRRASEAKGPFPGGKRVGSWGKKREMVGITLRGLGVGGRKRIKEKAKAKVLEKQKQKV